jgi:hypothetical protein
MKEWTPAHDRLVDAFRAQRDQRAGAETAHFINACGDVNAIKPSVPLRKQAPPTVPFFIAIFPSKYKYKIYLHVDFGAAKFLWGLALLSVVRLVCIWPIYLFAVLSLARLCSALRDYLPSTATFVARGRSVHSHEFPSVMITL